MCRVLAIAMKAFLSQWLPNPPLISLSVRWALGVCPPGFRRSALGAQSTTERAIVHRDPSFVPILGHYRLTNNACCEAAMLRFLLHSDGNDNGGSTKSVPRNVPPSPRRMKDDRIIYLLIQ